MPADTNPPQASQRTVPYRSGTSFGDRGRCLDREGGSSKHHPAALPALLLNSYAGVVFGIEVEDDRTAAEAG